MVVGNAATIGRGTWVLGAVGMGCWGEDCREVRVIAIMQERGCGSAKGVSWYAASG